MRDNTPYYIADQPRFKLDVVQTFLVNLFRGAVFFRSAVSAAAGRITGIARITPGHIVKGSIIVCFHTVGRYACTRFPCFCRIRFSGHACLPIRFPGFVKSYFGRLVHLCLSGSFCCPSRFPGSIRDHPVRFRQKVKYMQFHRSARDARMFRHGKYRSRVQVFLLRVIKFTDLGRHYPPEYEVHRVYDLAPAPEVPVKLYHPVFITLVAMPGIVLGKEQVRPCLPEPVNALLYIAHHEHVMYTVVVA